MIRARRLRPWITMAAAAACIMVLLPAPSQARPFDHVVVGAGVDGLGNRLVVQAYDSAFGGGFGSAIYRSATRPGPAVLIEFDCVVVTFIPSHFLHAAGRGSDGKTYHVGVFDDTVPTGRGPYDAISVTTFEGSGPCGTSTPYPNNWYPVSFGDYFVGP